MPCVDGVRPMLPMAGWGGENACLVAPVAKDPWVAWAVQGAHDGQGSGGEGRGNSRLCLLMSGGRSQRGLWSQELGG